jgi:hypothetical protein
LERLVSVEDGFVDASVRILASRRTPCSERDAAYGGVETLRSRTQAYALVNSLVSAAVALLLFGASILMYMAFPSAYAIAVVVFFALVFVWQVVGAWRRPPDK